MLSFAVDRRSEFEFRDHFVPLTTVIRPGNYQIDGRKGTN